MDLSRTVSSHVVDPMKCPITTVLAVLLLTVCSPLEAQETISYSNAQLTLINNVNVASLDPGVVKELFVQPGDTVAKGATLLTLNKERFAAQANADNLNWQIAVQEAKSDIDLRFARKSFDVSEKQLQKNENAVREYAASISETEIDRLRLERDQAMLSIEVADMELCRATLTAKLRGEEKKLSEIQLSRREIKSPISGLVAEVAVQEGESVPNGSTVVRVIGLNKLRVKAFYRSKYALSVKKGQTAKFVFQNGDEEISKEAEVIFVSPEIRATEKVFELWADVNNTDRQLLPGFKGVLEIEIEK